MFRFRAGVFHLDFGHLVSHTPRMKPTNRLLTLLSLTTVVITVERVSPTTRVLMQPYKYLHLHEVVQMGIISAFSVVISFLLLRGVSHNFRLLQDAGGTLLGVLFILGTYFYATGNGVHEVASFLFNEYCDTKNFTSTVCGSMYFNDYYVGNIIYFAGLGLSNLALVLLELRRPDASYRARDLRVTLANGAVLALTFFAYDAFDRASVGLVSTIMYAMVFDLLLVRRKVRYSTVPFTLYSALGFTAAAILATPVRLIAGA
jgi:hypothetical protein